MNPEAPPAHRVRYWTEQRLLRWIRWWLVWPLWFFGLTALLAPTLAMQIIAGTFR